MYVFTATANLYRSCASGPGEKCPRSSTVALCIDRTYPVVRSADIRQRSFAFYTVPRYITFCCLPCMKAIAYHRTNLNGSRKTYLSGQWWTPSMQRCCAVCCSQLLTQWNTHKRYYFNWENYIVIKTTLCQLWRPAGVWGSQKFRGLAGIPRAWKQMLRDSRGDKTKLCGNTVLYLTFMVHLQQQKFVFKLLKNVCSDFTDTNCIIVSQLII